MLQQVQEEITPKFILSMDTYQLSDDVIGIISGSSDVWGSKAAFW